MQANPKQSETEHADDAQPGAESGAANAGTGSGHVSPARALQARLVKELAGAPARSWPWHSAGLVLTTILALWLAGLLLNAGI